MKYSVEIRFGEEPETMPEGMKFGRVSAVTTDAQGNVYVFKRDPKTDQLVVFDASGKVPAVVGQRHVHAAARPPDRSRSECLGVG